MTPSELKQRHETWHPDSHYFSARTMRFFGDTMANYGVRRSRWTKTQSGEVVDCWELYRRKPVRHGFNRSAFFNVHDFSVVYAEMKEEAE